MTADSVTNWVTAVGAAGAFLVASLVYLARLLDRRREQAALVSAWFAWPEQPTEDHDIRNLHVRNGSSQPVYDVRVWPPEPVADALAWELLPPDSTDKIPAAASLASRYTSFALGINLAFTDAAGRRWERRAPDFRLKRIRRRRPPYSDAQIDAAITEPGGSTE
jgi:hypothetical protein